MQHKNKYNVDLEERGLVPREKTNNNRSVIPEKRTNASNISMELLLSTEIYNSVL